MPCMFDFIVFVYDELCNFYLLDWLQAMFDV